MNNLTYPQLHPIAPLISTPRRTTLDDVPQEQLLLRTVKLYLVGSLAWDYTDTVLDMAAQMRISALKRLSRTIRELHCDYDWIRARDLDSDYVKREWELAELFETINKDVFSQLCNGLLTEIRRDTSLNDDYVVFVEAVQMAMTILDALTLYAAQCDTYIRRYYPDAPHSILPDHFRKLAVLLPEYAGDCYDRYSNTRRIIAKTLLNKINEIELDY